MRASQKDHTQADPAEASQPRSNNPLLAAFRSPVLLGLAAAGLFYALIPYLPIHRELADRYFCGHPIEYVSATLFFVGMALLIEKSKRFRSEREALALVTDSNASTADPMALAESLPRRLHGTEIVSRLRDAGEHLTTSPTASGYSEHLKYLAELAGERLHGSYALVRTIGWAIPILGFLGTVIGITLAIANIKPEQLSNSLGDVTGNLAIAFDTTALALALSLVLVFSQFMIERAERSILDAVESFSLKRLTAAGPAVSPLAQAEMKAAHQLVEQTDSLIRTQTAVWQDAVETIRKQWTDTLEAQRGQLGDALSTGLRMTLDDHAEGLKEARLELVAAVTNVADRFDSALQRSDDQRAVQFKTLSQDLSSLWDRAAADLDGMRDNYQRQLSVTISSAHEVLRECRGELRDAAEAARSHREELARHGEVLERVAGESADVIRLEEHLVRNLEALQATDTLQDAVHSLTAAAHLLNTRSRNRAA